MPILLINTSFIFENLLELKLKKQLIVLLNIILCRVNINLDVRNPSGVKMVKFAHSYRI